MSQRYDAIVIGAGHNGLVAAAFLARAGFKVQVLEKRAVLGGAAATEEIVPGFHFNTGSDDAGLFHPDIIDDLQLYRWGLSFHESSAALTALNPSGRALTVWRDMERTLLEDELTATGDNVRFPRFVSALDQYTVLLSSLMTRTPPDIGKGLRTNEALSWTGPALKLRRMGGDEMMSLLRLLPMSVADFLGERLESTLLVGALATAGVRGTLQGPIASGTAFQFLYTARALGFIGDADRRFVQGGMGGIAAALAKAAGSHQAEIRTGAEVDRIMSHAGKAAGVRLVSGEEILSPVIISSADPRTTFFKFVGAEELPLNVVRKIKNIRFRGSTAKVNLALSGLPSFSGVSSVDGLKGRIIFSPSVEYLERAYDDAKYGRFPANPALEIVIPTVLEPDLAPPGGHILSVTVRYATYALTDSSWAERREELGDLVIQMLSEAAPDLPACLVGRQILTPFDLEKTYGLPEGSIYHGQMGLDQLAFMRPIPGYSRYRAPIDGLYLCGAGSHPGGGVTGAPGYNAAREIFSERRRL